MGRGRDHGRFLPTFSRLPRPRLGRIDRMRAWMVVLLCLVSNAGLARQSGTAAAVPQNPCAAPEQKQLEFWVGDWDLTWPGPKQGEVQHGTNSIHRLLDQCVVQENFSGGPSAPLQGMSVSIFD